MDCALRLESVNRKLEPDTARRRRASLLLPMRSLATPLTPRMLGGGQVPTRRHCQRARGSPIRFAPLFGSAGAEVLKTHPDVATRATGARDFFVLSRAKLIVATAAGGYSGYPIMASRVGHAPLLWVDRSANAAAKYGAWALREGRRARDFRTMLYTGDRSGWSAATARLRELRVFPSMAQHTVFPSHAPAMAPARRSSRDSFLSTLTGGLLG